MTATVAPGATIGFWQIIAICDLNGRRAIYRCQCGATHAVATADLAAGFSTSCGCRPSPALAREARASHEAKKSRRDLFDWRPARGR
jgi:hypothetical protein